MTRGFAYCTAFVFMLAPLAGCGDDGTGTGDQLTESETEDMVEAMGEAGTFSAPSTQQSQSPPAQTISPVPVNFTVDKTRSCPGGGTVDVQGTVEGNVDETGAGEFTVSLTQTPANCTSSAPSSNTTFTFNGDPSLTTSIDMSVSSDGSVSITGSHSGGIAWEMGDRSGSCSIDLTFNLSGSGSTLSGSVSGTACGNSISTDISAG